MSEPGRIEEGDEWPVYRLHSADHKYGPLVNMPDGFAERYYRADTEWWTCQQILRDAYRAAAD